MCEMSSGSGAGELLLRTVFFLRDYAGPHRAKLIKNLIINLKWEFTHPPYSPDLALSDYHLFPRLKKELG